MTPQVQTHQRPRVVIIGAGFGGLEVARHLGQAPVDVVLLDRNNYHGFWPLLYQVATAGLEPQQIAKPVRAIIRRTPNVQFRVAEVQRIEVERQTVVTDRGEFPYDQLVVASGSTTNYFGLTSIERKGFDLKDVPDALLLRNHLVNCFERAVDETDPVRLQQLLTFVVVGGGPTGVEMAGAISELIRHVMRKDFPSLDFKHVRVVLVEALDTLLPAFPKQLAGVTERSLKRMGVEVRLKTAVAGFENDLLQLKEGAAIPTDTVIWAAGVQASPLGKSLGIELAKGGRVPVTPALQLQDHPNVWVLGDLAHLEQQDGKPYPQLATVAMQQGRFVARNITHALNGKPLEQFRYWDKGIMATIGRRSAVARIWRINWSGQLAWMLWLVVHLLYLAGFQNRVGVLINWAYNYFTYDRGARAIISATPAEIEETVEKVS